jgi:hypothetical protein
MEDNAAATSQQRKPLLFVSHKHSDSEIANVIHEFVRDRSGNRVRVFQSSSAWADGPRFGRPLKPQLAEALWDASMVILVYTTPDHDWSYCMWECGVATDPQSPDTRPIVFQCGRDYPQLFAGEVRVNVRTFLDVQRFVNQLMTTPNFFPGYEPITDFHANSQGVQQAAQTFYDSLQRVLPPDDEEAAETIEPSWPYPFLRLELSSEIVGRISDEPSERRASTSVEAVLDSQVVESDGELRRIFGRNQKIPSQTRFRVLVDGWTEKFPQFEPTWLKALSEQISAAVRGMFPTLRWELMRGMDDYDGTWYAPVVNCVRTIGSSQCMQFDVYFDKFELGEDGKTVKVGVPPILPASGS